MSGYSDNYLLLLGSGSGTQSPQVPSINIKHEPGSPVNTELLSRSLDIKRQLAHSFQGNGGSGGISKPQSRRNSAFHVTSDQDDDEEGQNHERKRRDHINDRIQELLTLIPAHYFQDSAKEQLDEVGARNTGTKDGKPNKGQILTKSVDYIKVLQNTIDANNRMEVKLLLKLRKLEMYEKGSANTPVSVGTTSAELALGEIGVGPHSEKYFHQVLKDATGLRES